MNLLTFKATDLSVMMMAKGKFKIEQKINLFIKFCIADKRMTNAFSICLEFKAHNAMESRLDSMAWIKESMKGCNQCLK